MSEARSDRVVPAPFGAAELQARFDRLRAAHARDGGLPVPERRRLLARLRHVLLRDMDRLAEAVNADFGTRSRHETLLAELLLVLNAIRLARRNVARWARTERRPTFWGFLPARSRVQYQPLGVVGILAPWNYPLQLTLHPVVSAIAAGNRVLLKPSEHAPRTAAVLESVLAEAFPADVAAVVTGDAHVAEAFCALPFDHLLFTGSGTVGRLVMAAAAKNLTPVTLELGGKSPAIVHESHPLAHAAERIAFGKLLTAGQICVAPDYVLCPAPRVDALVRELTTAISRLYPTLADNPDYASIIDERHYERLVALREDARAKGARVVEVNPAGEDLPRAGRKIAPTLLVGVDDRMAVTREEIFGPLLPIVPYGTLEQALAYVAARPKPLALYYFDRDPARVERVLAETTSGGACVNDTLLQLGQPTLPFGGVGASGTGRYQGLDGFRTFSHARGVVLQRRWNAMFLLSPPWGRTIRWIERLLLR